MPVNDRHPSTPVDRLAPAIRSAVDTAGGPLKPIISSAQAGSHPVQADRLAPLIDQIVLKPEATAAEVEQICRQAVTYGFAGVCVNAAYLALVSRLLAGSDVRPGGVVAFPLGASLPDLKASETEHLIALGAQELDMVVQVGALIEADYARAAADVRAVVQAAHPAGVRVTLILKTSLLSEDQKMAGCLLAGVCRADFVRSSTGFGPSGATVEDVRPMRTVVGSKMGVKAAGGIRTAETALRMIVAGASRLGTSTGVAIVEQVRRRALAASGAAGI